MVMHKTQRRVMLKFLKQHDGKWTGDGPYTVCDLCYCQESKSSQEPVSLASYIEKMRGDNGPYSNTQPKLCNEHAQELSLVW